MGGGGGQITVITQVFLIFWAACKRPLTRSWNTWTTPRPNHRPIAPPTWNVWRKTNRYHNYSTSERKLLRVDLIMSVVFVWTVEEKDISMREVSDVDFWRSVVWVCAVLQGRGQSETWVPSTKSCIATEYRRRQISSFLKKGYSPHAPSSDTSVDTSVKFSVSQIGVMLGNCFFTKLSSHSS